MGKAKGSPRQAPARVTVAQAFRDVLIKAMTTGQLVPITISIVLMIAAWRLPEGELAPLAYRILEGLMNHSLLGYGISVVVLIAWSWHASLMRRCFSQEARRIGNEKTQHQQARTTIPLGTSDK